MKIAPRSGPCLRFGSFELDLRSRELRKHGTRLKLQGQPIDLLEMLLERPGELVTREELHQRLWPHDTFVDFEHGLNIAVSKLRAVMGDRASTPRYIETLPRRGYRFIASVARTECRPPSAGEDEDADAGEGKAPTGPGGRPSVTIPPGHSGDRIHRGAASSELVRRFPAGVPGGRHDRCAHHQPGENPGASRDLAAIHRAL